MGKPPFAAASLASTISRQLDNAILLEEYGKHEGAKLYLEVAIDNLKILARDLGFDLVAKAKTE